MTRRFAIKKCGWVTLVSILFVCALCTPGESWTPQDYDGQWQVYSPGWSYMWMSSGNYAIWRNDAIGWGRFVYAYTPGQWFDGSWNSIGNNGASSAFIGDGAWHNLNNGWSHYYTTSGDYAVWMNNAVGWGRFVTAYGPKQWFDGSWNPIGTSGASTAFLGDGTWHDLNNGWSYNYVASSDYAVWKNNAVGWGRFVYAYTPGQWYDGSWNKIGVGSTSSAFLGDGTWHDLNNGWSYDYISAYDYAAWKNNAIGSVRFISVYTQGQWFDGTWNKIGGTGTSMAFLGDGGWHSLNDGWRFQYSSDVGYYGSQADPGSGWKFSYSFLDGIWKYQTSFGIWTLNNGTDDDWRPSDGPSWYNAMSSAFVGDGQWHGIPFRFKTAGLRNYWYFMFDGMNGYWKAPDNHTSDGQMEQYRLNFSTGKWSRWDYWHPNQQWVDSPTQTIELKNETGKDITIYMGNHTNVNLVNGLDTGWNLYTLEDFQGFQRYSADGIAVNPFIMYATIKAGESLTLHFDKGCLFTPAFSVDALIWSYGNNNIQTIGEFALSAYGVPASKLREDTIDVSLVNGLNYGMFIDTSTGTTIGTDTLLGNKYKPGVFPLLHDTGDSMVNPPLPILDYYKKLWGRQFDTIIHGEDRDPADPGHVNASLNFSGSPNYVVHIVNPK
jgi:hypothetical protein